MSATKRKKGSGEEKPLPKFLKPKQVAEELQVTRRTVYTWLTDGTLPGLRIGPQAWRITRESLDKFVQSMAGK